MQDVGLIALIASVFGGAGLKIIEWYLTKGQRESAESKAQRDELRGDLANLKLEFKSLSQELDKQKVKYLEMKSLILTARTYIESLIIVIESLAESANKAVPRIVTVVNESEIMKGEFRDE